MTSAEFIALPREVRKALADGNRAYAELGKLADKQEKAAAEKALRAAKRRAKLAKVRPFAECKRVGGLTFFRLGRLSLSFCVSR